MVETREVHVLSWSYSTETSVTETVVRPWNEARPDGG